MHMALRVVQNLPLFTNKCLKTDKEIDQDEPANERLHNAKAHGPPNTVWKRVISSVCAIILFLSKRVGSELL
jgi:hypothetical protein